jgi:NADPH-dependent 2,4-dienoyl-CoA reductase/sulfur reductase-like enzyme
VTFDLESLQLELTELGASHLQRELFEVDVGRARAAIAEAANRGAGNPLSYAVSLFRSEGFQPEAKRKPKPVNAHGRTDPSRTDDGERIWQSHEVDSGWLRGYLADCIEAMQDGRDPAARYAPSDEEMQAWVEAMKRRVPVLMLDPLRIWHTASHALDAWAEVWDLEELRMLDDDPEPALDEEPAAPVLS